MKKDEKIINKANYEYGEPKEDTLNGWRFKVYDKIDGGKKLKDIVKEEIENFEAPKKGLEFIDNLIKLDYITSVKYKSKEINFDNLSGLIGLNDYPSMKYLVMFYKKKNCKVYIDNTIDQNFYNQLQKYYFNNNIFKNKIRIQLHIDKNKLKDEKIVKNIIKRIIETISKIMDIPVDKLYAINVRRNCLLCDIIYIINRSRNFFVSLIDRNRFNQNLNILRQFLRGIEREMGNNDIFQENTYQDIIEIRTILDNIIISPYLHFNNKYNKKRGNFWS